MRIALLRGDDYHNRYLDQLLRKRFDVVLTIIEPGDAQRKSLRRRGKLRDAIAAEYHRARRSVLGLQRYRKRFFSSLAEISEDDFDAMHVIRTDSINSPLVQAALEETSIDVCILTCVSILSRNTLEAIDAPVLNIHGGHLPDYRGCHCFFFALYDGQFDKIGSTIHFVDTGIDTGDIVEVVKPAIVASDNAERLYCRAEHLAAHRLVRWLELMEEGADLPRQRQQFRGRLVLRRHRLPHHDIIFWVKRWTRIVRLPNVDESDR